LVEEWPDTRILLTSRPLPVFAEAHEVRRVPPLTDEEMLSLVGRVAEREIGEVSLYGWAASLRDAARRPLFAILLGLARREAAAAPRTTGELISFLVTKALGPTLPDALPLLMRLALLASDGGERSVHADDVGAPEELDSLVRSRLVVREGKFLRFGLPILTQWFAAQALIHRHRTSKELLANPLLPDRWRYALAIAVATTSRKKVDALLGPLAREQPGLASVVIGEAVRQWPSEQADLTIESLDAARALRTAYLAWDDGLAPISAELLPHETDGTLATVAAGAGGPYVDGGGISETILRPKELRVFRPMLMFSIRSPAGMSARDRR
jgi:hypothetical protein